MDRFRSLPHLAALGGAYVLVIPIRWSRERSERSAGLRTFPLVAITACGFVHATEALLNDRPEVAARIIDGVITGIGLIVGSAIVKHGQSVLGTATAAVLFATGAVGIAVGLRAYEDAVVISVLTFLTLRFLNPVKRERPDDPDMQR